MRNLFKRKKANLTIPHETIIEDTMHTEQAKDITYVRELEGKIMLNQAQTSIMEAHKKLAEARIEATKWRKDRKEGREEAVNLKLALDDALYCYGNREELLYDEYRDSIRDVQDARRNHAEMQRDADQMLADAVKGRMEVEYRISNMQKEGLMS